jgi:hypothetical protein
VQVTEANKRRVQLVAQLKGITDRRNLLTGAGAAARRGGAR